MTLLLGVLVFLSHASTDQDAAAAISRSFWQAGCQVWTDRDQRPGDQWTRAVERQIDRADVVVVLVSPASYRSDWVRAELLRAVRRGKRIVPVVLEPGADLPLPLEGLHRIPTDRVPAAAADICRPVTYF